VTRSSYILYKYVNVIDVKFVEYIYNTCRMKFILILVLYKNRIKVYVKYNAKPWFKDELKQVKV